jgi:hypothetical protein
MWIVRLALDRPYTFIVLAVLILFWAYSIQIPTDIFPESTSLSWYHLTYADCRFEMEKRVNIQ